VEVVCDLVYDHGEGGTLLLPLPLVIGDDMRVAVPQLPELTRIHTGVLDLIQKRIVDRLRKNSIFINS
jgi:hypothetical protein